jgi:hypothetical protein
MYALSLQNFDLLTELTKQQIDFNIMLKTLEDDLLS